MGSMRLMLASQAVRAPYAPGTMRSAELCMQRDMIGHVGGHIRA
jgi:hypothetical protein